MSTQENLSFFIRAFGPEFGRSLEEMSKYYVLDMLLPDGTRFGDAMPIDLAPYANKTMEEIVALLADPDKDEGDFLEDGASPAPSSEDGVDFISEEEDENPTGVIR
jgi:hypothetical protein